MPSPQSDDRAKAFLKKRLGCPAFCKKRRVFVYIRLARCAMRKKSAVARGMCKRAASRPELNDRRKKRRTRGFMMLPPCLRAKTKTCGVRFRGKAQREKSTGGTMLFCYPQCCRHGCLKRGNRLPQNRVQDGELVRCARLMQAQAKQHSPNIPHGADGKMHGKKSCAYPSCAGEGQEGAVSKKRSFDADFLLKTPGQTNASSSFGV